ncbi:MAG: hypothetical protein GY906_22750 [bacterium]|nr:hypothetical protein [bacterium]
MSTEKPITAAEVAEMLADAEKYPSEASIDEDGKVTITDPKYRLARALQEAMESLRDMCREVATPAQTFKARLKVREYYEES